MYLHGNEGGKGYPRLPEHLERQLEQHLGHFDHTPKPGGSSAPKRNVLPKIRTAQAQERVLRRSESCPARPSQSNLPPLLPLVPKPSPMAVEKSDANIFRPPRQAPNYNVQKLFSVAEVQGDGSPELLRDDIHQPLRRRAASESSAALSPTSRSHRRAILGGTPLALPSPSSPSAARQQGRGLDLGSPERKRHSLKQEAGATAKPSAELTAEPVGSSGSASSILSPQKPLLQVSQGDLQPAQDYDNSPDEEAGGDLDERQVQFSQDLAVEKQTSSPRLEDELQEAPEEDGSSATDSVSGELLDVASSAVKAHRGTVGQDPHMQRSRKNHRWKVFSRLEDDGEVHRDKLVEALSALGVREPKPDWVEEAIQETTEYSTLSFEEFVTCLNKYEAKWAQEGAKVFALVDGEEGAPSGTRHASSLPALLKKCGMSPLQHVIDELVATQGDAQGCVDSAGFMRMAEELRTNECFNLREAEAILNAFRRFDRSGYGILQARGLQDALRYLGRAPGARAATKMVSDFCGAGAETEGIHERAFLAGLRRIQEHQDFELRKFFKYRTARKDGTLHRASLPEALGALGYVADVGSVMDCVWRAGFGAKSDFSISDLWKVILEYIDKEGLSDRDLKDAKFSLEESVERCRRVGGKEGPQAGLIATSALRSLGYSACCDLGLKLQDEVGAGGQGELELADFLKIVRMYRELLVDHAQLLFSKPGIAIGVVVQEVVPEGCEKILRDERKKIGYTMGGTPSDELTAKLERRILLGEDVTWQNVASAARVLQEALRKQLKGFFGFTFAKIARLEKMYQEVISESSSNDGKGNQNVHKLLSLFFADLATSRAGRPTFLRLLEQEHLDISQGISFNDFLKLFRWCHEQEEHRQLCRGQRVVQKHSLSQDECRDLRDIFLGKRFNRSSLDLETFKEMMNEVIPLGHKNVVRITRMFHKVASQKEIGKAIAVDFPDFLALVVSLPEEGFATRFGQEEKEATLASG